MTLYLTMEREPDENGEYLAIISEGSPQRGDANVTVLSVTHVKNMKQAKVWFKKMKHEKPWETRQ